jgi:PAS domain-containing protein
MRITLERVIRMLGSPTYKSNSPFRRFGFALVSVVAAILLRQVLGAVLGFLHPYALFYPTIAMVAMLFGFWLGFFATVLSAASATYYFLPPSHSFVIYRRQEAVGLALFVALSVAISALGEFNRRREAKLKDYEEVVEGLEEMVVVVDRDYRYRIANSAYLKYLGIEKEQLIGRPASEILDKTTFDTAVRPGVQEGLQGNAVKYELRHQDSRLGE